MGEKVYIFDTTLRDGEQAPGFSMTTQEKLQMAQQLANLKVDIIEAGFAAASKGDWEAINLIAREVKGPVICSLARALEKDIEAAASALKPAERKRIHTFIATSPIHMKYKLKMSPEEVLKRAVKAVRYARNFTDDVEFSCEDATRSERVFLYKIIEAVIKAGATVINIPDTVGYAIPDEFYTLIKGIKENVPNIDKAIISVHCHDDLGLATANSLMAVLAGARQVECTINGIGERAGNAALEEVVMALKVRKDHFGGLYTDINTPEIYKTSRLLCRITGTFVQPNKAIVGENAFAHESGIHQHGVLAKRETYEIMKPEDVGFPRSKIVLGKHSGRHALKAKLKELGYEVDEETLNKLFEKFKALADQKKEVYEEDLEALIYEQFRSSSYENFLKLLHLQVQTGSGILPTAMVKVIFKGEEKTATETGNGPVDAAIKAIQKATELYPQFVDYSIKALTPNTDAQAEARVVIELDGIKASGRASDIDIVKASVKAYVDALNRLLARREYLKAKENVRKEGTV
ncbi:MAG TPA: 2-isopropylmalate synthase [Aquifex aeolicus]|uniref:2-isopropylmalate synthase n=1 Tax=Aquifex aeolicus TaxID=63363 RepID=A0A9D0YQA7_AQUAO|nr:2-isopropylmalate synthase [Aquificales bacterium]HIP98029.1 2-isopropylmalate synthase [Aquifex aeolicus]HIQ26066.1 2-isopropylmalate synthase [Aquifex aeolicus]